MIARSLEYTKGRQYVLVWVVCIVMWGILEYATGKGGYEGFSKWLDAAFYFGFGLLSAHAMNKEWI